MNISKIVIPCIVYYILNNKNNFMIIQINKIYTLSKK